jgi:uncharacterized protein YdhG (YjbR/CyaY superfamily)
VKAAGRRAILRKPKATPATVEEYLARLDDRQRAAMQMLRNAIHAAAPGVEECISYGVPGFRLSGRVLLHIGAAAKHCAIYPGAYPVRALGDALAGYDTSRGTVRFPADKPLPAALVHRLVKARIAEQVAARGPTALRGGLRTEKAQPPAGPRAARRGSGRSKTPRGGRG